MLRDPRFAWASYALFAVAVVAALFKIGVMPEAKPVLELDPPFKTAAQARPPLEEDIPSGPLLDLPEPGDDREEARASAAFGARFEGRGASSEDPSVFRRPSDGGSSPGPVCGNLGAFPTSSRAVFPLPESFFGSYEPGWGSPRPQGGHEGTDLMSPSGTPEFAVTDGTVVEVAGANEDGWNRLGGYTVMIRAAYDIGPIRKGDLFYYAHLERETTLPVGTAVRAGQRVGFVGDTGQGKQGTRGKFPSHLHFGWYDADETGRRSKAESGAMDPYPLLLWLERNGGAVSGGTDASYCEGPQGEIPQQDKPDKRPDMDTGRSGNATPTPAASKDDEHRRERHEKNDEPTNSAEENKRPPETRPAPAQEDAREPGPADDSADAPPVKPPKDKPPTAVEKVDRPSPGPPDPDEPGTCDKAKRGTSENEPREREEVRCEAPDGPEEPASPKERATGEPENGDERHPSPAPESETSDQTGEERGARDAA